MAYPIRTVLWFNGRGREAATFYCSLIPGSRVEGTMENDFSSEVSAFEDRYGMSWQITPKAMMEYLAHPDLAAIEAAVRETV